MFSGGGAEWRKSWGGSPLHYWPSKCNAAFLGLKGQLSWQPWDQGADPLLALVWSTESLFSFPQAGLKKHIQPDRYRH